MEINHLSQSPVIQYYYLNQSHIADYYCLCLHTRSNDLFIIITKGYPFTVASIIQIVFPALLLRCFINKFLCTPSHYNVSSKLRFFSYVGLSDSLGACFLAKSYRQLRDLKVVVNFLLILDNEHETMFKFGRLQLKARNEFNIDKQA